MILNLYLRKLLTPILVINFILIGVITFDYAEHFARWFVFGLLFFTLIKINARDINMTGLLCIIIFERSIEEIAYLLLDNFNVKVFVYLSALIVLYIFKYDKLVKLFCIPLVALVILVELFWWFSGYDSPRLHPYVFMLLLNLITRHLLFMRVPLTDRYATGGKSLPLDWKIYGLAKWSVLVIGVMLIEYLIRHVTPLNPLNIYYIYTPLMHAIAVTTLFFVTDDYLRSRFVLDA